MPHSCFIVVVALVALFSISSAAPAADENVSTYIFEDQILATLKNLSEQWAEHDPLLIPEVKVDLEDSDFYGLEFEALNILVYGFSNFRATNLKISVLPPAMHFNIQFEKLRFIIPFYRINGYAAFVPVYGSGSMDLQSSVINAGGSAKVAIGSSGISGVKNLKLTFNLTESNLKVTGFLHNEPVSEIISTATTECFPEFVNTYGNRIGELVGAAVEGILNKKNFLSMLSKEKNKPEKIQEYSGSAEKGQAKINYSYKV